MNSCPPRDRLQQFLADQVSAADGPALAAHVETCPGCSQTLEQLTAQPTRASNSQRITYEEPAPAFFEKLEGLYPFAGEQPVGSPAAGERWPEIPNYEILRLLGKGGMGVVYQARDRTLKRVVALKMVLAGSRADGEQMARFRAEAEAVARLEHPHIVQVFTSGSHNGEPYLVMGFVDGGSLDRKLQGQPQPPRDAARLVLLLAWAVHTAHQAGVVHRDLKPANILLAPPAGEPALNCAYGCPRLTDFGLVKFVDNPADQTNTGKVLGTPAYMAPEQATGDAAAIGPAADVWALGVILYEMLTGAVPFKGKSLLETLQQVRSGPLELPRRRCPTVPPALEAICQKCLRKAPGPRYASAAALADDLGRFLAEAPVSAPPARDRAGWWTRRRLLAAAAAAVLSVGVVAVLTSSRPGEAPKAAVTKRGDITPPTRYRGRVDVVVERVDADGTVRHLRLNQPGALPLRKMNKFRIEGQVDPPAYLYVVWVDPNRDVTPVYPWDPTVGWGSRPAKEEMVKNLRLPRNPERPWYRAPMAQPGVATMVLFARPTPLDVPDEVVKKWFEELPELPLPAQGDHAAVWFDDYLEVQDPDRARTFELVGTDNPFAHWQGQLRKALGGKAAFQTAVSFARTGGK